MSSGLLVIPSFYTRGQLFRWDITFVVLVSLFPRIHGVSTKVYVILRISAPTGEVITQAVIRDRGFGFPSAFLGDEARAYSYQRNDKASKLQGRGILRNRDYNAITVVNLFLRMT